MNRPPEQPSDTLPERLCMGPTALPEEHVPPVERTPELEPPRRGKEDGERERFPLNTSPVTGNSTNNPDNNIVSRTLEGNGGRER